MSIDDPQKILIAAITAPHGLDGSVKLKLFGDDAAGLKRYKGFTTDRDMMLTLKSMRVQGDMVIARFDQVADRTAAEHWRGTKIFVSKADLPRPAADEMYHIDLINMQVITPDGAAVGSVIDVVNYGAGDLLDVKRLSGGTILIPYRDVAVLNVDATNRRITVEPAFLE
jgi:16S rRNA processing protein RimM